MRQIDRKYATSGDLRNVIKNEPVPEDEPLMLFRGRDRLAPAAIEFYLHLLQDTGADAGAIAKLTAELASLRQWQASHPERTRMPNQPQLNNSNRPGGAQ